MRGDMTQMVPRHSPCTPIWYNSTGDDIPTGRVPLGGCGWVWTIIHGTVSRPSFSALSFPILPLPAIVPSQASSHQAHIGTTVLLHMRIQKRAVLTAHCVLVVHHPQDARVVDPNPELSPYLSAAQQGDMAMLRCLRRVGYPVPTNTSLFLLAVLMKCCVQTLQWMVDQGCPVDWEQVEQADKSHRPAWRREWSERSVWVNTMWRQALDRRAHA